MIYNLPRNYYFRLHQVRPRFKNDVENVLLYVANEISKLEALESGEFKKRLSGAIKLYPGNATRQDKTIQNWRTEIAALFGFIEKDQVNQISKPGKIAKKLADEQDLVQFFKYFLFYFQYPGGHIKPERVKEIIDKKIKFKPAQYFLKVLKAGESIQKKRFSINKAEATHFIYNDLRVTRDHCKPKDVVNRIMECRNKNLELNWNGDIVRYAGDVLDYMVIANLLVKHGSNYYLNWKEQETIITFIESKEWFGHYDQFYESIFSAKDLRFIEDDWFSFVNKDLGNDLFRTDILEYLEIEKQPYLQLVEDKITELEEQFDPKYVRTTKEIGDFGENLVLGHECMKVKIGGRKDLINLIKKIPTSFAVGYDIQSVELDQTKRYIEVKTTISRSAISFYNFHLTANEWSTAETLKNRYFVYRLLISKSQKKLFIINDPVKQYKNDKLKMSLGSGADIIFNSETGEWTELLIWKE